MSDESRMVELSEAEFDELEALAPEYGVELRPITGKGIDPLTGVVVAVIGTASAVAGVMRFIDQRRGGQVIDMRPATSKPFYRSADLAYGLIVVFAIDGSVTVQATKTTDSFSELVGIVGQVAASNKGGGIASIEDSLRQSCGDGAIVRSGTEPT